MTMENHPWMEIYLLFKKKQWIFQHLPTNPGLSRGIRNRALGRSSSLRGDKPNSFPKRRKGLGVRTEPRGETKRLTRDGVRPFSKKKEKNMEKKSNEIREMKINEWNENKPQEMRGSYQEIQ